MEYCKLSIRKLPPSLLKEDFFKTISNFENKIVTYYYMKGKNK